MLIFWSPKVSEFNGTQFEYIELVSFSSNVFLTSVTIRPVFSNVKLSIKHLVTLYNKVLLFNVNNASTITLNSWLHNLFN